MDCKVDILVEADIKRRSHQRAEQIKKAREEFLGISTEEVFSEAETASLKNRCPPLRHLEATTRTNNEACPRYSNCHLEISSNSNTAHFIRRLSMYWQKTCRSELAAIILLI